MLRQTKNKEQGAQDLSYENSPFCRPNNVGKRKDHFKLNLIKGNQFNKSKI